MRFREAKWTRRNGSRFFSRSGREPNPMPLSKDLREFVECLNSNGVEYLIVGALAVSWHGYPRYSADVDLFVNASPPNAIRVLAAIQQFGFGSLGLTADDFTAPARVIQFGQEPNRIDLMTSISGVGFEDAWQSREAGELDGIPVTSSAARHCCATRTRLAVAKTELTPKSIVSKVRIRRSCVPPHGDHGDVVRSGPRTSRLRRSHARA